jgi:hypothetical protein
MSDSTNDQDAGSNPEAEAEVLCEADGDVGKTLKAVAKKRARRGPGFSSLLGLLFIGLKLTGHIDWSWWWVLAPLWIPGSFLTVLVVVLVIAKQRTGWKRWEQSGET